MAISYWAVAFLDLLGYRSVLDGLDAFPLPDGGVEHDKVQKAFTKAIHLRRRLLGGIRQFLTQHTGPSALDFSTIPQEMRPTAELWRRVRMFDLPGPDHIVLGCSLAPDADHFPMRGVYTLMFATASAMILQLMIGAEDPHDSLPLRGGIDVAPGGLLQPENFLYSPALTRAYDLEHERAIYPRALIGQRFRDYIRGESERSGTPTDNYTRQLAQRVSEMFFEDRDGETALDFLGEAVRSNLEPDFAQRLAGGAWRYAQSALAEARHKGTARILAKYEWLVTYMEPRVSRWGVNS